MSSLSRVTTVNTPSITGCPGPRCRIPEFVKLGRTIRAELDAIHASLDSGLSNALIESTNTKIRLLTRMAFGFKHPEALISLALLALGGYRPELPHRTHT